MPTASRMHIPIAMSRIWVMSTIPPKSSKRPKPELMVRTSGPKMRLSVCWIVIASPKVASSEVKRSSWITRRMISTYRIHPNTNMIATTGTIATIGCTPCFDSR